MPKSSQAFRTISEVADDLHIQKHVLRFWESKFTQLKPMKRGGGRRYYRPEDVELLRGIHHLLRSSAYTIKGVQRILRDQGVDFVKACWQSGAQSAPMSSAEPPATPTGRRGATPAGAVPIALPASPGVRRDAATTATPATATRRASAVPTGAGSAGSQADLVKGVLEQLETARTALDRTLQQPERKTRTPSTAKPDRLEQIGTAKAASSAQENPRPSPGEPKAAAPRPKKSSRGS